MLSGYSRATFIKRFCRVIGRRSKLLRSRSFNFDRNSSRLSIALSARCAADARCFARRRVSGVFARAAFARASADLPLQSGLAKPRIVRRAGTIGITPRRPGASHGAPPNGNGVPRTSTDVIRRRRNPVPPRTGSDRTAGGTRRRRAPPRAEHTQPGAVKSAPAAIRSGSSRTAGASVPVGQ